MSNELAALIRQLQMLDAEGGVDRQLMTPVLMAGESPLRPDVSAAEAVFMRSQKANKP